MRPWISVTVSTFCCYNKYPCFLWLLIGLESRYKEQKDAETGDNVKITRQWFGKIAIASCKNLKFENSHKVKICHKCENKFPLNEKMSRQMWKVVTNVKCYTVTNKKLLALHIYTIISHLWDLFTFIDMFSHFILSGYSFYICDSFYICNGFYIQYS